MKPLFYVLAVVAIGAAGFFGWNVNKEHAEQLIARNELITKNKNLSADINKQEGLKKEADDALKVSQSESALAEQGLKAAKSNFEGFERTLDEISGLLEEANAEEAQVTKVKDSLQLLFPDVELEQVPKVFADLSDQQKKLTAESEELQGFKERLENDVAKNKADIVRIEEKIVESRNRVAANTFQATVTAVDNDWDFVVIGAGEKSGLSSDSRLLVQRGGRLLGKLSINKLEANRAIADVVPDSLRAGVVLQPGDQVILEKTLSN
ncbi:MAG: hypothetical protein QNL68_12015 [Akkermansiaceae bacterium]|jgi:uncharacterized protein YoxC